MTTEPRATTVRLSPRRLENDRLAYDRKALDDSWRRCELNRAEVAGLVVIDLREVPYIAHECLLFLVGILRYRLSMRWQTLLDLPRKESVLDYLQAWKFPEAVRKVTGQELGEFLTTGSRDALRRVAQTSSRYVSAVPGPHGGRENLLPVSYFALTPVVIDDPDEPSLVKQRWLEKHLVGVLDRYLSGYGDRVATHIIHEGVLNAANHPHATIAYTSAQLLNVTQRHAEPGAERGEFEIAIWDDGDSFADTLHHALRDSRSIRSPAFGMVPTEMLVKVRQDGSREVFTLTSRDDTTLDSPAHLTAAAFMLGVTSLLGPRPDQHGPDTAAYSGLPEEILPAAARNHGGLGLYLILRTVVDLFGGNVRYVSNRYRASIRLGASPGKYVATIDHMRVTDCGIQGNLLVATIPLGSP